MPVQAQYHKLLSWGSATEIGTINQAIKTSRLPFVTDHVALMPDAHVGIGSTVGSVIPTKGAIIPAAIGVDIGCGMVAILTDLTLNDLPLSLDALRPLIYQRIPAGVGKGHEGRKPTQFLLSAMGDISGVFPADQADKAVKQFATLGSGNHFLEVCFDENGRIWIVLHSGSRGIGNTVAQIHMAKAKGIMKHLAIHLEDPDLAYLVQGTQEFDDYITDMRWAQKYAFGSRELMAKEAARSLFEVVGHGSVRKVINCHHNYTEQETHNGETLWITRKGAIRAGVDDLGVVPGSMGTASYIVRGLGNPLSWESSAHGAGRKMSRGQAKRELDLEYFKDQMTGVSWDADRASALLDEAPGAYKDIHQVMADQDDLTAIEHELHQVFNYKG